MTMTTKPEQDREHPALPAPDAEALAAHVLPKRLGDDLGWDQGRTAFGAAVRSTSGSIRCFDVGPGGRSGGAGVGVSRCHVRQLRSRRRVPQCCHAQTPGRHVLDDALSVERRDVVLHHHPPQVQDGDPVGHGEDVVEVVRDHQHRQAVVPQASYQVEHHRRLRHAQSGRRLVHDDQLGVPHHRLGDRHRLALTPRQRPDRLADRPHRRHPQAGEGLGRGALHVVLVEQAVTKPLASEEHVLDDVEIVGQGQVLVDGLDAQAAESWALRIRTGRPSQ